MDRNPNARAVVPSRRHVLLGGLLLLAPALANCTGSGSNFSPGDLFGSGASAPLPGPGQQPMAIGTGQTKIALILPLNTLGNAGQVGQSMRNAAELAVTEFNNPDIQLLVKDDGGSAQGAQFAAQQALTEGSQLIIGPLFAQSVQAAGQVARAQDIPVIAFSTDSSVAARGVYLLSFLPESDVQRIVDYAIAQGKRSYVALVPDNAYGNVVDSEFRQYVARKGGRVVAIERYPAGAFGLLGSLQNVVQAAGTADALFLPGEGDIVPQVAQSSRNGRRRSQTVAVAWHRPVGGSPYCRCPQLAGRLVSGARPECAEQFPHVRRPLPGALQQRSGAYSDAGLRCGCACLRAGQDARRARSHQ